MDQPEVTTACKIPGGLLVLGGGVVGVEMAQGRDVMLGSRVTVIEAGERRSRVRSEFAWPVQLRQALTQQGVERAERADTLLGRPGRDRDPQPRAGRGW